MKQLQKGGGTDQKGQAPLIFAGGGVILSKGPKS
jgi:hypothetical protein